MALASARFSAATTRSPAFDRRTISAPRAIATAASDAVLQHIETTADRWLEDDVIDIDVHRTGGLIELSFPGGSKIVINTQPPLHELWLGAEGALGVILGAELRIKITETIGVVPFFAGGNVLAGSIPGLHGMLYGAGLGLPADAYLPFGTADAWLGEGAPRLAAGAAPSGDLGSCTVFPAPPASLSPRAPALATEAAWNQNIAKAPRAANSAKVIAYIDSHGGTAIHPDRKSVV